LSPPNIARRLAAEPFEYVNADHHNRSIATS